MRLHKSAIIVDTHEDVPGDRFEQKLDRPRASATPSATSTSRAGAKAE